MVQIKLLAKTGHQYFFSGVVAQVAEDTAFHNSRLGDPRDLGPREIDTTNLLLDSVELRTLFGLRSGANPWAPVDGHQFIRFRLGSRNYLNREGTQYTVYGVWFAVETNVGTVSRGYIVSEDSNEHGGLDQVAPTLQSSLSYAASDKPELVGRAANIQVSLGPELDSKIPATYRTLAIIWQKPSGPPINVDLIVDFGNTRTAVFALEQREDTANQILDFQRICRPVGFMHMHDRTIEIPPPSRGDAEPFLVDSWFVFQDTNFSTLEGSAARMADVISEIVTESRFFIKTTKTRVSKVVSRMPLTFVEKSPVVLGPWAKSLLSDKRTSGGRLFMSSPKRYAWDDSLLLGQGSYWTMTLNQWAEHDYAQSLPPLGGEVLRFVYANDRPWKISAPPTLDKPINRPVPNPPAPFHARGCTMTLAALAILESAYRQITSYEWRRDHEEFLPRTLRNIQVTYPSGWTTDEINTYRSKWQNALNIFAHTRIPLMPNGSSADPEVPVPLLRMTVDEAVAAQLPIVYTQIRNLRNDGDAWARLYGKPDGPPKPNERRKYSVRVMSIDIGGGTTDTSIVEYRNNPTAGNVNLNARLIFRDSSTVAGDRLVKNIIEKVLLPSLGKPLLEHNDGRAKRFKELFSRAVGSDTEREDRAVIARLVFMPLVVKWLQDMAAGRQGRAGGGFWSWTEAGCDAHATERLRNVLKKEEIDLDFDTTSGFGIDYTAVAATASEVFRSLASLHAQLVAAYDCDLVVMTGKPSELSPVRELFERELPLAANRVVSARGYRTQDWFPLTADGTIPDAKLVTAVGAALARAIDRRGVAGWDPIKFDSGYEQRYCWGRMPPDEGAFLREQILIADMEELDVKDGQLFAVKTSRPDDAICDLSIDTTFIGRHLFRAGGRPEQIYQVRRRRPPLAGLDERQNEHGLRVTVRLKRETEESPGSLGITERLVIDEVLKGESADGVPLTTGDLELKLCTLVGHTHWLDTGQFLMEWEKS